MGAIRIILVAPIFAYGLGEGGELMGCTDKESFSVVVSLLFNFPFYFFGAEVAGDRGEFTVVSHGSSIQKLLECCN